MSAKTTIATDKKIPSDLDVMTVTCTIARANVTRKNLQWRGYKVTIMGQKDCKITFLAEKKNKVKDE